MPDKKKRTKKKKVGKDKRRIVRSKKTRAKKSSDKIKPETINKINLNEKLSDFKVLHKNKSKQENMSLFGLQENETSARNGSNDRNLTPLPEPENDPTRSSTLPPPEEAIYQAVLPVIQNQLTTPVIPKELSKTLNVSKAQLSIWLDKAVEDGHIQKLSRPVRFLINKAS